MKKKKVLFITSTLQHYRIPILNLIANYNDIKLTVAHSGKNKMTVNSTFEEVLFVEKKIGPFTIHKNKILSFCNQFDVVVAMFYLQKISLMRLLFNHNRKYKIIYWGIGVRASYTNKFDSPTFVNKIRYFLAKKSDAMIFYTDYAREKYINKGINADKLFVMQNTVEVKGRSKNYNPKGRNSILFMGTINKSKKIFELLEAYKVSFIKTDNMPKLEIVGTGADFDLVKSWVENNDLSNMIIIHGAIFDEVKKKEIFERSIVSISPGQAGLSVLTSFGYGVSFITYKDAITGGERLNIIDEYNGLLFSDYKDLERIIIDIATNKDKYLIYGKNALNYYNNNRTPKIMAQGFIDAANFVLN